MHICTHTHTHTPPLRDHPHTPPHFLGLRIPLFLYPPAGDVGALGLCVFMTVPTSQQNTFSWESPTSSSHVHQKCGSTHTVTPRAVGTPPMTSDGRTLSKVEVQTAVSVGWFLTVSNQIWTASLLLSSLSPLLQNFKLLLYFFSSWLFLSRVADGCLL